MQEQIDEETKRLEEMREKYYQTLDGVAEVKKYTLEEMRLMEGREWDTDLP